jgi:hypothetical protein
LPARVVLALLAAIVALSALPVGVSPPVVAAQEASEETPADEETSPDEETPADEKAPDGAEAAPTQETPVNGEEVIVVLEKGADPLVAARELGVQPTHIYEDVLTGFAAVVPPAALNDAIASGSIKGVTRDRRIRAEGQVVGTGVLRVGVPHVPGSQNLAIASPIDADIAVLDTVSIGAVT